MMSLQDKPSRCLLGFYTPTPRGKTRLHNSLISEEKALLLFAELGLKDLKHQIEVPEFENLKLINGDHHEKNIVSVLLVSLH
jgi:hypothetical protein